MSGESSNEKPRIGLTLSGGGFRATVFHLGVVSYLRDAKLLSEVKFICCVSGGSVLGAHLAKHWKSYTGEDSKEFRRSVGQLVRFLQSDVRGKIARQAPLRAITYFFPKRWSFYRFGRLNWFLNRFFTRRTKTQQLITLYDKGLFNDFRLSESDVACPEIHLLSLCINNVRLWSFNQRGIEVAVNSDSNEEKRSREVGLIDYPVALPVAASSAFTAYFEPVEIDAIVEFGLSAELSRTLLGQEFSQLTDGGVYDNLGAEKLDAINKSLDDDNKLDLCIYSDASGVLDFADSHQGLFAFLLTGWRAVNILMERIQILIEQAVFDGPNETDQKTDRATRHLSLKLKDVFELENYIESEMSVPQAQRMLAQIRTDLDRFTDKEISGLYQHGYQVAKKRISENLDKELLVEPNSEDSKFDPSGLNRPLNSEDALELSSSKSLNIFGFVYSIRDPFGWLNAIFTVSLLSLIAVSIYSLFSRSDEKLFSFEPGENASAKRLYEMVSSQIEGNPDLTTKIYKVTINYDDNLYERFVTNLINIESEGQELLWRNWAKDFDDLIASEALLELSELRKRLPGSTEAKIEKLYDFVQQCRAIKKLKTTSGEINLLPVQRGESLFVYGKGNWDVGDDPNLKSDIVLYSYRYSEVENLDAIWIQQRTRKGKQYFYEFVCEEFQLSEIDNNGFPDRMSGTELKLNLIGNQHTNDQKIVVGSITIRPN